MFVFYKSMVMSSEFITLRTTNHTPWINSSSVIPSAQKLTSVIRENRPYNRGQLWVRGTVARNTGGWAYKRPASVHAIRCPHGCLPRPHQVHHGTVHRAILIGRRNDSRGVQCKFFGPPRAVRITNI